MNLEAWKLAEQDKKKKEKSEKQKVKEEKRIIEQQKKKEEIREVVKANELLNILKDLLSEENKQLTPEAKQVLEKAISWESLSENEIEEILNKIDEIENIDGIDDYLPKESRITKEEYKKAITDDKNRTKTMKKLDNVLTVLANQANPNSSMWLNLFSWYMAILNRRLVRIQDNHIDIKDSLEKVEEIENPKELKKLSWWQKFMKLVKEIFNDW